MGLSILGGIFGHQKPTTRSASSSTTLPARTPEAEQISQVLRGLLQDRLTNPQSPAQVGGIRNRGRASINKTYDSLGERIESANARRGFGRSGVTGSQRTQLEVARAGEISDLDARLEEYLNNLAIFERDRTTRDAMDFIRLGSGSRSSSESRTVGDEAPSAVGRGFNAGLEDLSFLLTLSQLLGEDGRGF
jgi:hypothetical protein